MPKYIIQTDNISTRFVTKSLIRVTDLLKRYTNTIASFLIQSSFRKEEDSINRVLPYSQHIKAWRC